MFLRSTSQNASRQDAVVTEKPELVTENISSRKDVCHLESALQALRTYESFKSLGEYTKIVRMKIPFIDKLP